MKAALFRTDSLPILQSILTLGSPRVRISRNESFNMSSPRISLHLEINSKTDSPARSIRRALSENNLIRSGTDGVPDGFLKQNAFGSRSLPSIMSELECLSETESEVHDRELLEFSGKFPENWTPPEELGSSGDGFGKGNESGDDRSWNDGCSGGSGDVTKIGDYYREMLKSNPGDSLLLRNYGKYLHEVERDAERAEEYYSRAILASPGDGEVLSQYGKLIWETRRDGERAKSYFDQAVYASPNDCMVLGSYANFLWETEEDEEDEEINERSEASPAMVAAF
ncbi:hypothetical protein HS088_TW16G00752 [Tripterygium wilfordii]|uniref:TmcB/TmcC TPR repeats domain-containing protein n=1 Tax=Tripterygium wilfordii TaxID=458696 RepID=A0A7J7CJR8_TRIWF|nr:uncharacterized protein LOC119981159 [Tripterygium wilfordii]KAF5734305.1 hypothetical protein HS088_TW16G00752 [Tripterygium wilfordii]